MQNERLTQLNTKLVKFTNFNYSASQVTLRLTLTGAIISKQSL